MSDEDLTVEEIPRDALDEPMRLNDDGPDYDGDDGYDDLDDEDDDDDIDLVQVAGSVALSGRCEVTLSMSLTGVTSLEHALDTAAINLGRYGVDPFYVILTDPETGRRWVVNGGRYLEDADNGPDGG